MDKQRKKLIALIKYCTSCEECRDEDIADHLIANGVTVQEPQKPIEYKLTGCGVKIGNAFWGRGTTVYKCPKCGGFISRIYDYCYKCGQALDWGESYRDKDCEHGGKDPDVPTELKATELPRDFGRWIPVEERKPDVVISSVTGKGYSEAVNVLTSGRNVITAIYDGEDFIGDAGFWEAEDEVITHWTPVLLPLPEPPKEG